MQNVLIFFNILEKCVSAAKAFLKLMKQNKTQKKHLWWNIWLLAKTWASDQKKRRVGHFGRRDGNNRYSFSRALIHVLWREESEPVDFKSFWKTPCFLSRDPFANSLRHDCITLLTGSVISVDRSHTLTEHYNQVTGSDCILACSVEESMVKHIGGVE